MIAESDTPLARGGHPQVLVLIDHRRDSFASGRFRGPVRPATSTLNHQAFEIPAESYQPERARLAELGLEPNPVELPDLAARSLFFHDPDGNIIEFICHAAQSS